MAFTGYTARQLLVNFQYDEALSEHGIESVRAEIRDMTIHEMADIAFRSAIHYGYTDLVFKAAIVINEEPSFALPDKKLAQKILRDRIR